LLDQCRVPRAGVPIKKLDEVCGNLTEDIRKKEELFKRTPRSCQF
jgi:hypothetical protein